MKTGITVSEAMTEKPIFLRSDDTVRKCAEEMEKNHVGAIIVKDNGKAVGILTEKDIVRKAIAKGKEPLQMKIKEIMETDITTIAPEKDIFDALIIMRDFNIRHLPVIDGEKMIGLLTLKDILKIEPQLFDLLVEKFELREESRKPIYHHHEKEGICQICGKYAEELSEVDSVLLCSSCKEEQK